MDPTLYQTPVPKATSGLAPQLDTGLTTLTAGVMPIVPTKLPISSGNVVTWKSGAKWHELWQVDDAAGVAAANAMWLHGSDPLPTSFDGPAAVAALEAKADPAGTGEFAHLDFRYYRLPSFATINGMNTAVTNPPGSTATLWRLRSGHGAHSPTYVAGTALTETGRLYRVDLGNGQAWDYYVLESAFTSPDADTAWELELEPDPNQVPASVKDFLIAERTAQGGELWRFVACEATWTNFTP